MLRRRYDLTRSAVRRGADVADYGRVAAEPGCSVMREGIRVGSARTVCAGSTI
jgi:hypothetical protein